MEAEYRSMCSTLFEIIWLKGLLNNLGFKQEEAVILYCDNNDVIQIANNPFFS